VLVRSVAADRAHNLLSNESVQARMFETNYLDSLSVCDRLQLLDAGGFEATGTGSDGRDIWQHLVSNGRRIVFVPVVLGYCYALPVAAGRDDPDDPTKSARLRRIFDPIGVRERLPINSNLVRYHPRIGLL
jgi:hypothetical protein